MTRLVCPAQWVVVTALLLNLFVSSRGLARCQECCTCSDGPSQCSACVSNGCCCGPKTLFLWNCCPEDQDEDDEDTIVTDRPDFTESASTVGLGRVQLEMGYSYAYDKEITTSASAESYPELLTASLFDPLPKARHLTGLPLGCGNLLNNHCRYGFDPCLDTK